MIEIVVNGDGIFCDFVVCVVAANLVVGCSLCLKLVCENIFENGMVVICVVNNDSCVMV